MAEVIRDEDVRARVRAAQEFLDPGMLTAAIEQCNPNFVVQRMRTSEATDQTFW